MFILKNDEVVIDFIQPLLNSSVAHGEPMVL